NQCKRHDARNVEEIAFISRRSELCSPVVDTHQLDRKEAVGQMHGEDRNQKQNDGWNTHERNESANQESDANRKLSRDCDPGHEWGEGNTSRLKNAGEHCWSPRPFRQAVGQESIPNNQSKEGLRVGRKPRPCLPPSHYFRRETRHFSLRCPDTS